VGEGAGRKEGKREEKRGGRGYQYWGIETSSGGRQNVMSYQLQKVQQKRVKLGGDQKKGHKKRKKRGGKKMHVGTRHQ